MKNRRNKIILISILSAIFILIIVSVLLIFCTLNKISEMPTVELGDEKISTITSIIGKKKVTAVSVEYGDTSITKTYTYKSEDTTFSKDIYRYYLNLCDKENFEYINELEELTATRGGMLLVKQSKDEGKLLAVYIYYDTNGYKIVYKKDFGQVEKH